MPDNEFLKEETAEENSFDTETLLEKGEENFPEPKQEEHEDEIKHTYVTYIPYGFTPEEYEEHLAVKKASRAAGTTFLVMDAVIVILNLLLAFGFAAIEKAFSLQNRLLSDPAVLQAVQIFLSVIVFTLPFGIVYKLFGYRISDLIEFSKPKKNTILPMFLFGVAFCAFANIATSMAGSFFKNFGVDYEVARPENPEGVFGFILSMLATVAVPSLVEEFACRGIVLGSLRKFGDGFAIIISAILFGLMHGNFEQIPFAFLVGLALGFVTIQSGSIWIAVAIHAFNNSVSVVFDYFFRGISVSAQNIIYTVFLCVSLLLGLVALFFVKDEAVYKFTLREETKLSEKEKYKAFFKTAVIIIFIVLSVLSSLQYFV